MKYFLLIIVILVSGCSSNMEIKKKAFKEGWYMGYDSGIKINNCRVYKGIERGVASVN